MSAIEQLSEDELSRQLTDCRITLESIYPHRSRETLDRQAALWAEYNRRIKAEREVLPTNHAMNTLSELQTMIAAAATRHPAGRARTKELKAIQWRMRGPCGEFVGMGDIHALFRGRFVPESESLIFDGRDNEVMKLAAYSRDLGPLTVEIIPQIVCAS